MTREKLHFVTGRLAEPALRAVVAELAAARGFDYTVDVQNITVAALLTTTWLESRVHPPPETTRILLPGYCTGELAPLSARLGVPVERGPKDLRELPSWFGQKTPAAPLAEHDIEIVAEINYAQRRSIPELLAEANRLAGQGADVIDLGCVPGETWREVGTAVRALRDTGRRVSIDSLDPTEIAPAAAAGAELVFSVNRENCHAAADWGVEVVAIPDDPRRWQSVEETLERLDVLKVPYRVDPILSPIGFGFGESLLAYAEARRRWPRAPMLMGIGNVTELTEVDSAGLNLLLLALCEEWNIRSVLTTEVINWCRASVQECDIARKMVCYAIRRGELPKHVTPNLVALRDRSVVEPTLSELGQLAAAIRDKNWRLLVAKGKLQAVRSGVHLSDSEPFGLWEKLSAASPKPLSPDHAFYLGFELAKAQVALALGKQYRQDEALDWGPWTREEISHRARHVSRDTSATEAHPDSNDETSAKTPELG